MGRGVAGFGEVELVAAPAGVAFDAVPSVPARGPGAVLDPCRALGVSQAWFYK